MTAKELLNGLQTTVLGRAIQIYEEVQSTNDLALQHGTNGSQEGTLILADYQTAGRGKHGRKWHAPAGSSILASLILRHRLLAKQVGLPNLIGAVSIATAIRAVTNQPAMIKWPNDVLIDGKKVSGVLTELAYDRHRQPFLVMGFGVNVNTSLDDFPIELRLSSTSLHVQSNRHICRTTLLQTILSDLEENYFHLKRHEILPIIEKANHLSYYLKQRIHIQTTDEVFDGIAERIDLDGGLIVSRPGGERRKLLSGEVVHVEEKTN